MPFFIGINMVLTSELQKVIEPVVVALGYEYVGAEWRQGKQHGTLCIYIDSESGITLDDCAQVSRQVGSVLDVEDLISGEYNLEVSSPGLDRPLFRLEHYQRFIGNKVTIRTRIPVDGRRNFTGVIQGVGDQTVLLKLDEKHECQLNLNDIDKARLVHEF